MELRDRVAVITGGTGGIGAAIARKFVEEGALTAIIGHSDDAGRKVEAELKALAGRLGTGDCSYFHADVGNSGEVRAAIAAIVQQWRAIHVLVNNAAVMATGPLIDMPEAEWDQTAAVNMRGPFLMSKYAIPHMPEQGVILNISSVHAVATDTHSTAYSASKGWLEAFTRGLALECYERRIRVNALRLGAVDTDMLWNNPHVKSGEESIDAHEVGKPAEVAEVALFLASHRSSFISGTVVTADGGRLPILGSQAATQAPGRRH
ncbi:SDR family NAD(P)-dependent oxidoreductase [Massilia soli]|uniref:SDR family oxidoreductase n=1 Tax=Massilia soli TaxID=2792854 RepID=A0ABS7SVS4_9BURK|nr:SDR family oxidoreductase [Massilia soli]MBZ2210025.1 SDR family oxidoreductase [Massilia soli]